MGLLLIFLFFYLVSTSPLINYLRPLESKEYMQSMAESLFIKLPINHSQYRQGSYAGIDRDLLVYAQYYQKRNNQFPDLFPGIWTVEWARIDSEYEQGRPKNYFETRFDFKGNLIGFRDNTFDPNSVDPDLINNITEDDALFEAKYFLGEYGIKTSSLIVANRKKDQKGDKTQFQFILENKSEKYPDLLNKYTVELLGNKVIGYQLNRVIDKQSLQKLVNLDQNNIFDIMMLIVWSVLILILIFYFIKMLRKDELEFKHALWIGIALSLFVFSVIFSYETNDLTGSIVGGVVVAFFVFLGILVALPTVESQNRTTWPEKLIISDLLFQGKIFIRESGVAILRSYFLMGVTLFVLVIFIRGISGFGLGYILLDSDMVTVYQNIKYLLSTILKNIVAASFIVLIFLSFWPAFLKKKINNFTIFWTLLAISFSLGGIRLFFFKPDYIALLVALPISVIWALLALRYDLFTIFLSYMGTTVLLKLSLIFLIPGTLSSITGTMATLLVVLFFILGIFLVFRQGSAEDYDNYVPDYVSRIAERERLSRELEIARSVQMRFLPRKIPECPSIEIASICQPAMEVGGDYYDFIQIGDRYLSILIGDVSGKGVSAAFYMTMVKGIIKTLSKKIKQPSTLLAEANDIFCENSPGDIFITIIYGVFDLKEKSLTIASAGHPPLIVWKSKTKTIERVNPKGIALGLDKSKKYREIIEEKSIPIEENDILVFYTDGVSESMNMQQEIFGEDRLQKIIEDSAHLPPQTIQKNIINSVNQFAEKAAQHDDFTMVVVKVQTNKNI
jgi:hypothetical protein